MKRYDEKYDNKFVRKTIRFSQDEFANIEKNLKLANVTFTEYARSSILKYKLKTKDKAELEKIYQLKKIGNNLNQIAYNINAKNKIDVLEKLIEIEKYLKEKL